MKNVYVTSKLVFSQLFSKAVSKARMYGGRMCKNKCHDETKKRELYFFVV